MIQDGTRTNGNRVETERDPDTVIYTTLLSHGNSGCTETVRHITLLRHGNSGCTETVRDQTVIVLVLYERSTMALMRLSFRSGQERPCRPFWRFGRG